MKFFSLILVLPLLSTIFYSQAISQSRTSGGEGYFMVGIQKIDVKNLNSLLRNNNYPVLNESYPSIGGGGYGIINNFVIGGEGHG
ncbi:MAG: hypothetical protein ACPL25_09620 [Ignavibacteria bacterium]